ncbi:hypothetical protein ACFXC8_21055 [Streptomyces sp. NPDC059441]|uniref:hypothetical protein n=1 Tax=Streptomyces sp. NPDC059441 TaxID=3346829 RepID=UPI0036A29F5C
MDIVQLILHPLDGLADPQGGLRGGRMSLLVEQAGHQMPAPGRSGGNTSCEMPQPCHRGDVITGSASDLWDSSFELGLYGSGR